MFAKKIVKFLCGIAIGSLISLVIFYPNFKNDNALIPAIHEKFSVMRPRDLEDLYNETLADKLFDEVRLLCWIMTTPANHKTKAIHIKNTWGKRCNKLLFMSTSIDLELETIALPVKEGRETLWDKTKNAFQYVYKHHYDDADWFMKADDDNYMIPENIRYMLHQYRPQTALYFGHRYALEAIPEGYMAGGGYILSKAALNKFVTKILHNNTICSMSESGAEDWDLGRCLQHSAISVDARDDKHEKRFFPAGIMAHLKPEKDMTYWYDNSQYYEVAQGNLSCCSKTPAGFHYIGPHEIYMLEYLTRMVHPFGLEKSHNETLPRKFSLKEILRASDVESKSIKFKKHFFYHNLDESEKYRIKK